MSKFVTTEFSIQSLENLFRQKHQDKVFVHWSVAEMPSDINDASITYTDRARRKIEEGESEAQAANALFENVEAEVIRYFGRSIEMVWERLEVETDY